MASTPMDIDKPVGVNTSTPVLNIQRSLGTSNLSDVVQTFRPTKVRCPLPTAPLV